VTQNLGETSILVLINLKKFFCGSMYDIQNLFMHARRYIRAHSTYIIHIAETIWSQWLHLLEKVL